MRIEHLLITCLLMVPEIFAMVQPVEIKVDPAIPARKLERFWVNQNLHTNELIYTIWGDDFLDLVKDNEAAMQFGRMYNKHKMEIRTCPTDELYFDWEQTILFDQQDSPEYLHYVKAYADAMMENGRDRYGEEHTPLFAAALDRNDMRLGTMEEFGSIPGIRETDRSLGGSNPLWEIGLYEILYALTEYTGKRKYAEAADQSLSYFFNHCQSPNTFLMAWGEHLFWDFENEAVGFVKNDYHEAYAWPFLDRCYSLAPKACWNFALGEWDHQVANQETGDFSRHARYLEHGPEIGFDFPRYAGQMIERWAYAYGREENKDKERRGDLLRAMEVMVSRMEGNMEKTGTGSLPAKKGADFMFVTSNLELARCLTEAKEVVDGELAERMERLALAQDCDFLKAPHEIGDGGGFAVTLHAHTGEPRHRSMNKPYSATWATGYGYGTHASVANLLMIRISQLEDKQQGIVEAYKTLILHAADQYLHTEPDTSQAQNPDAFADVMELMLTAYQLTGENKFLQRCRYFADMGIELFLDDGLPLPKATSKHDHYETITGGPVFMHALLKLALSIQQGELGN